jgi:hypothetical protein
MACETAATDVTFFAVEEKKPYFLGAIAPVLKNRSTRKIELIQLALIKTL